MNETTATTAVEEARQRVSEWTDPDNAPSDVRLIAALLAERDSMVVEWGSTSIALETAEEWPSEEAARSWVKEGEEWGERLTSRRLSPWEWAE